MAQTKWELTYGTPCMCRYYLFDFRQLRGAHDHQWAAARRGGGPQGDLRPHRVRAQVQERGPGHRHQQRGRAGPLLVNIHQGSRKRIQGLLRYRMRRIDIFYNIFFVPVDGPEGF